MSIAGETLPGLDLHWDEAHGAEQVHKERTEPSALAIDLAKRLGPESLAVELGCGDGVDSACLAKAAGSVVAIDFAGSRIRKNREEYDLPNLTFVQRDIAIGLDFDGESISAILARRSLHYFDDATTKRIFEQIGRALIPGGQLFFEVKSVNDPHSNQQPQDGYVRHFFSHEELQILLPGFEIESEEHKGKDFYGYKSVFLNCRATKNK